MGTATKESFLRRIIITPGDCWEWIGYIESNGYGRVRFQGIRWSTHRLSWTLHYGEIPSGLHVCHQCDNRKCINPMHLFVGTHSDNMQDAISKGRKTMSPATRQKMSESHRRRWALATEEERKAHMARARVGRWPKRA